MLSVRFQNPKIRISRAQKQIYLHFAEREYLSRSRGYEKEDPGAKANPVRILPAKRLKRSRKVRKTKGPEFGAAEKKSVFSFVFPPRRSPGEPGLHPACRKRRIDSVRFPSCRNPNEFGSAIGLMKRVPATRACGMLIKKRKLWPDACTTEAEKRYFCECAACGVSACRRERS